MLSVVRGICIDDFVKTPFATDLDVEAAASLRTTAAEVGATLSDLTALCVRYTLSCLTKEKLTTWAKAQPRRVGRPAGSGSGLTKIERAVLMAFDTLRASGAEVVSVVEIARAAGLPVRDAYIALPALEARGQVQTERCTEIDRWGRPAELVARLSGKGPTWNALEAVRAVRAELEPLRVEPLAAELIRKAMVRTSGWSIVALNLTEGEFSETFDVSAQQATAWLQARWPVAL